VEIGITNSGWLGDPSFLPVLKDRLQNDVDVKIFFLDPTCHAAETRALEDSPRPTIATIQKSIQVLWEFRNGLSSPIQQRLHVFVYTCTPSSGTTWVDNFMIVTHYLPGCQNVTSPSLVAKPVRIQEEETDLYQVYSINAIAIEKRFSIELNDANISRYCPPPSGP
jgi:hypothetical protein